MVVKAPWLPVSAGAGLLRSLIPGAEFCVPDQPGENGGTSLISPWATWTSTGTASARLAMAGSSSHNQIRKPETRPTEESPCQDQLSPDSQPSPPCWPPAAHAQQVLEIDLTTGRTIIDDEWRSMSSAVAADWDGNIL